MPTLHTRSTQDATTNQVKTVDLSAAVTQEGFNEEPPTASRYTVSLSNMISTLKASSGWIVIGALATIISLVEKVCRGKTVTASIVMGEALSYLTLYLCIAHITNFKGRSRRSWLISWLFRFTMLFASSSVSEVAKYTSRRGCITAQPIFSSRR